MQSAAGFSEATVRAHSAARGEPEWMLNFRLEAWRLFEALGHGDQLIAAVRKRAQNVSVQLT